MKTENTSTEKLIARRDALLEKAQEAAKEIQRLQNLEADKHRQTLRYATATLGGYVVYKIDPAQRDALIAAAVMHEKKKSAREALQILAATFEEPKLKAAATKAAKEAGALVPSKPRGGL